MQKIELLTDLGEFSSLSLDVSKSGELYFNCKRVLNKGGFGLQLRMIHAIVQERQKYALFLDCASLWYFSAALLQAGMETPAASFELRMITNAWLLFSLVIAASYTANLTVFLGIKAKTIPFKSIWEVSKSMRSHLTSSLIMLVIPTFSCDTLA